MKTFTTPIQEIAVSLAFDVVGEDRVNRRYDEYMAIAARLPPLKVLLHKINERLQEIHKIEGHRLPKICRFKAGDQRITYEPFPATISYETLRGNIGEEAQRFSARRADESSNSGHRDSPPDARSPLTAGFFATL